MSETINMALKKKPKHIKGKYSMSKPSCLISFNNENIFNTQNVLKSNKNNTPTRSNKEFKMSVKTINNKSFVLRPKNKKHNEKIDKMLSKKLIYNNGKSFIQNVKKISKNKCNKNNPEKKSNNPFHARIKSFQIDFKDKNFFTNINKTEKNNEDKTSKKQNNIKENRVNNELEYIHNDYTMTNNNFSMNKTHNLFEDIEENSTKNTKIFEQKTITLDNLSMDEKIVILSDKQSKKFNYIETEREKPKEMHYNNNKHKIKKLSNLQYKDRNIVKNNSFTKRNRPFSPSMRNKLNNIRKNILVNKDQDKKNISSIINKNYETHYNFSKTKKYVKKDNQNQKTQKMSNLIKQIKDKLQIIQTNKNNNNNCSLREDMKDIRKGVSFIKERKTVTNGYNPFQLNKVSNSKKNNMRKSKVIQISGMKKSPIAFRRENILSNASRSKNKNRNEKDKEKEKSNIVQIKDNKNNFNKNIHDISIIRKVRINKKLNNDIKNSEKQKQKLCLSSKSQNDVLTDFVVKNLNKEEQEQDIKDNNKEKTSKKQKELAPKDLETKKLDKIENLCQKGFSGPGIKKINQDNFFIYNNFMNNPNYIFTGVCDGHGTYGHNVSGYLVYNLPLTVNDILIKEKMEILTPENNSKVMSILKDTFLEIDRNISLDPRIDSYFSGSTCVSIVYTPSKLICANLGDSRCIIGKYDGKNWFSKNISNDHKPNNPLEEERIIKSGGRVESYKDEEGNYLGPKRVWLKDEEVPGLAMSRSFGDRVAHSVGVISEPDISEYSFLHEDKFIILASDGIWEFISNEECVNYVKDYYIKKDINGALNFLYKEASKRWIIEEEVIDDITLILIFFE